MSGERFARVSLSLLDYALYQMAPKRVESEPERYPARITVNGITPEGVKRHSKHVTGRRRAA